MAHRSFWTGYLKLSLVTCRVSMTPATSEQARVRFHMLNSETGNRLASRYVDAETGKPVADDDLVKGYPRGEDDHVVLEDDELEAVSLESTRTIDIDMFVPSADIPWIWYDKPHYLRPDDEVGAEAFAVIRDAMISTRRVGIARLVLYRRERAVMLEPRAPGIVVWTLHYGDEVRDPDAYFSSIKSVHPEKTAVSLIKKLVEERTRAWEPDMVGDPVQENLLSIIAAKTKGRKRPTRAKSSPGRQHDSDNVISIVDALRKSLASEQERGKKR